MFAVLAAGDLFAQTETNSTMGWGDGFVKTNGEFVLSSAAAEPDSGDGAGCAQPGRPGAHRFHAFLICNGPAGTTLFR